jgi:Rrf2 family transcriptional regulator, iron-sulfur cluster assembly transcription factor
MLISRTDLLAIVAVVDIAIHGEKQPVRRSEIGPRHGLSERYFEQILQVLSGSNILTATRGKAGGYQLSRAPSLITAGEVLRAVHAPLDTAAGKAESSIARRIVLPALEDAQMAFSRALQGITIADLVRSALACPLTFFTAGGTDPIAAVSIVNLPTLLTRE